jgi:hypothetical protein
MGANYKSHWMFASTALWRGIDPCISSRLGRQLGVSSGDTVSPSRDDWFSPNRAKRKQESKMKMRYVAPLAIAAAGLTIGLAPIASAEVSVQQTPGNAQISASPGVASQEAAQTQMPFGGDSTALLFHHR